MADHIEIVDLHLRALVGINDEERDKLQDILINCTLQADLRRAGETDDIADAVNYRTITKEIIALVDGRQFNLLEKLADDVAALCLRHPGVAHARVAAEKPGALRFAKTVRVVVERGSPTS